MVFFKLDLLMFQHGRFINGLFSSWRFKEFYSHTAVTEEINLQFKLKSENLFAVAKEPRDTLHRYHFDF